MKETKRYTQLPDIQEERYTQERRDFLRTFATDTPVFTRDPQALAEALNNKGQLERVIAAADAVLLESYKALNVPKEDIERLEKELAANQRPEHIVIVQELVAKPIIKLEKKY